MTWGWTVKGDNLGTPAESAVKASWPDYNAEYLKKKLTSRDRRYNPGALDDTQRGVYLQETIKGYEGEAEACLKAEFEDWLQGTHAENVAAENGGGYYFNNDADTDGGPRRRHVYEGAVSTEMQDDPNIGTGWRATRWGTKQLTNLDGVRDYLRAGKVAQDNAERDMNLLAERGPQDLNEAWMYFKHWVKRRPVSTCDEKGPPGSNFDKLTRYGVDRMNGTGPSNWMSSDQVGGAPPTTFFGPKVWTPGIDAYYGLPAVPKEEPTSNSSTIRMSQQILETAPVRPILETAPVPATDTAFDDDPLTATDTAFETFQVEDTEMPRGQEMRAAATRNSQFGYTVTEANSALERAQQTINAARTRTDLEMASATTLPYSFGATRHPMSNRDIRAQTADSQRITQGVYPNPGFTIRQTAAQAAGDLTRDIIPQQNAFSMDSGGPSFGRTSMTDVYDDLEDVDL